jgi:hypothetical protein
MEAHMENRLINDDGTLNRCRMAFTRQRGLSIGESDGLKTLENVAIISAGEALGHGVMIDDKTLDQIVTAIGTRKLRAYVTHDGALYGDRVTREAGWFSEIKREDDRVMAGKFTPMKSFAKHRPEQYEALFELADVMPENWGVSIVPEGYAAWKLESGDELPFRYSDDKPQGAVGDLPVLRVSSVLSADFVDAPAANARGLFSANHHQKDDDTMSTENNDSLALNKQVTDLSAEVTALKAQIEAEKTAHQIELSAERTRVTDLLALGRDHKRDALALTAIQNGDTVDTFRQSLLDAYKAGNQTQTQSADASEINPERAPKDSTEFLATYRSLKKADPIKASEYMLRHASHFNQQ